MYSYVICDHKMGAGTAAPRQTNAQQLTNDSTYHNETTINTTQPKSYTTLRVHRITQRPPQQSSAQCTSPPTNRPNTSATSTWRSSQACSARTATRTHLILQHDTHAGSHRLVAPSGEGLTSCGHGGIHLQASRKKQRPFGGCFGGLIPPQGVKHKHEAQTSSGVDSGHRLTTSLVACGRKGPHHRLHATNFASDLRGYARTGLRTSIHFLVLDSVNLPLIRFFTVGCAAEAGKTGHQCSNRQGDGLLARYRGAQNELAEEARQFENHIKCKTYDSGGEGAGVRD